MACSGLACAVWLFWPEVGAWPVIVALVPWAARWYMTGRPFVHSPFDWPLLAFLISASVAVWSAYDRQLAWSKYWLIAAAVFIYYSFANWAAFSGSEALKKQAWLLGGLGSFIAVYFLTTHDWDAYPSKIGIITSLGRSIRSFVPDFALERFHPNVLAGAMAVLLPFSAAIAALAWRERNRRELIVGLPLFLIAALGLLLSGSRGAWIAVLAAAGLLTWWKVVSWLVRGRRRRRAWFFGSIAFVLLAVFILTLAAPNAINALLSYLPSLESGVKRADLYKNSLILVNDYPFLGAGLDNFMMLYSTYALLLHVGFSTHAHNLLLDLTIQQGILAVFIFLWMLLLMGEAVWRLLAIRRRRRRAASNEPAAEGISAGSVSRQAIILGAAALSVFVMFLHGLVDDPIYGTRMVILMFVPFAFAVPVLLSAKTPELTQQIRSLVAGLVVVAVILVFAWRPIYSLVTSNLASVRQGQAELGLYDFPEYPVQDAVRAEVDLESAIQGYERAVDLNAGNVSASRRLGQIMLSLGEYDRAVEYLKAAYSQTPWDNATQQMLGEAYLVSGQLKEGQHLWSQVDNKMGQLDLRAAWYRYLGDIENFNLMKAIANEQR